MGMFNTSDFVAHLTSPPPPSSLPYFSVLFLWQDTVQQSEHKYDTQQKSYILSHTQTDHTQIHMFLVINTSYDISLK